MTNDISHVISLCAAIAAIIIAAIEIIRSFRTSREADRAIELASLAIKRVSSSRASRLAESMENCSSFLRRNQASTSSRVREPGYPCIPFAISSNTASGPLDSRQSSVDLSIIEEPNFKGEAAGTHLTFSAGY